MKLVKNRYFLPTITLIPSLLLLTYLVIFSYFVPIIDEDFKLYAYGKTFSEVVQSCVLQYLTWNARIGDILSILLSTLPRQVYNIFNGICIFGFFLLLIFIAKIVTNRSKLSTVTWAVGVLLLFLALVFYLPMPNEVFFWRTGAANYFYPAMLTILYSIPLLRYIITTRTIKHPMLAVPYILLGVVVGHSNENVAPVLFAFFAFWVVRKFFTEKRLDIVFASSTVSILVGACLLLFGPSTQHRLDFYGKLHGNPSMIENILINIGPVAYDYALLLIPSLLLSTLLIYTQKDNILRKKMWLVSFFSYSVSVGSVFILLCAPYYTPRAMFFSAVILLIPVIANVVLIKKEVVTVVFAILLTLLLLAAPLLAHQLVSERQLSHNKQNLIDSIEQQLHLSSKAVYTPIIITNSRLIYNGYPRQEAARIPRFFGYPDNSITVQQ